MVTEVVEYDTAVSYQDWARQAAHRSFRFDFGLPPRPLDGFLDSARVERVSRNRVLAYGHEWLHIVVTGVVKETTSHGTERLWTNGALLGDLRLVSLRKSRGVDPAALRSPGSHLEFLTPGVCVSITAHTLSALLAQEPAIALFLAHLASERASTVESVYASTKTDPLIRVAKLMDYLTRGQNSRTGGRERIRWTRNGPHHVPSGSLTVLGPSQADIADALGIGRTTVEKSIAALRAEGVLTTLKPGTRSNRYYEIADPALLRSVARSDS